jgi:hypothetical protein
MAVYVQKNLGLLVLAVWLILSGLGGVASFAFPVPFMPVLAVLAGVLILIGR